MYTHYTIDNVPADQRIFYKSFQRAGQGGYDPTKCFFNPTQNNFLDIHSTPFITHTMCKMDQCYCYVFGTNPQPLPTLLPGVGGPTTQASQNQFWTPHKQLQGWGPTKRILQYSSTDAKCKKVQKQKSMFKKGLKVKFQCNSNKTTKGIPPWGSHQYWAPRMGRNSKRTS